MGNSNCIHDISKSDNDDNILKGNTVMNTFFIKKTNKNDSNIFKILFCWLFVLFYISLCILIVDHNLNELCLNPLPKYENSIIKYADQTKDHFFVNSMLCSVYG